MTKENIFKEITGIEFKKFYDTQRPKLIFYLNRFTKNEKKSEDLAHDSFIQALNKIETFNDNKSQIHTWLYTIAMNMARKDYQDNKKKPLTSIDKELNNESTLEIFLTYDDTSDDDIEEYYLNEKRKQFIRDGILNMNNKYIKYKKVLKLRHIDYLTYEEIAQYLKLNLGTVKSQLKKGRELIEKQLKNKAKYL